MLVELAAARERHEHADRARGVSRAREQQHVGAGARGRDGPLGRVSPDDVERVGDRDAVEPELAQQPVRRGLERRAARHRALG